MDTSEAIRVFEDHINGHGYTCKCKYCKASRLAIEALETIEKGVVPVAWHNDVYETIQKRYIDLLGRSRWIPVTERLPTLSDFCRYNEIDYCISVLRNDNEPDMIWTRFPDRYDKDYFEDCGYTHWMPLPEPPKEVE